MCVECPSYAINAPYSSQYEAQKERLVRQCWRRHSEPVLVPRGEDHVGLCDEHLEEMREW